MLYNSVIAGEYVLILIVIQLDWLLRHHYRRSRNCIGMTSKCQQKTLGDGPS